MRPLPFVTPYAFAFWALYVWVFLPEVGLVRRGRAGASRRESPDRGSYYLVVLSQGVAATGAFFFAFRGPGRMSPGLVHPSFWIGLAVLVAGGLLRRHCKRTLGQYFTADVHTQPGQAVIDRGAYAWVRHPSYLAGMLLFVGLGLALGNWASLFLMVAFSLAGYHYRMVVEERALEAALGEPYRAFMRSRKRLIPFVY